MGNTAHEGQPPTLRLVVVVEGGLVQNVFADVPVEVLIVDRDVGGICEAPDVGAIRGDLATVVPWTAVDLPEVVDEYFNDAEKAGLL